MAECYMCGCRIAQGDGHRRRVKVGASRNMFALNWRYYYADQLVCGDCAARYDWPRRIIFALVIIAGFVAYQWFKK